jgi:membrane-associated phospholipid phosphatase
MALRTPLARFLARYPSFIRDHDYAFHWFHGGRGYESFLSGHMAATAAVLSVLWLAYPRWRPLYAVAGCLVAAVLILSNFHFLSDVIAGALLGALIGSMTTVLFDKAPRLLARVE